NHFPADEAGKDRAARGTLQGEHCEFARAVARDAAEAGVVAAPARPEPEALAAHLPDGRIVEDTPVLVHEQAVDDLTGDQIFQSPRLERLERAFACKLIETHKREVEKPRSAAGGEVLLGRAHSARTSMKVPTATQRPATMRRW